MLKAGAESGATGENAVIVGCRRADVIVGPVGVVIADSLNGEISPAMALAAAQSPAKRILLPFNHCDNLIAGVEEFSSAKLVQKAVALVQSLLDGDRACAPAPETPQP